MDDIIKEMTSKKENTLDGVVDLVINTVKAKHYHRNGGWELVRKELGENYLNPNFNMYVGTLHTKMVELGKEINGNVVRDLQNIVNAVNEKAGTKIVETTINSFSVQSIRIVL